MTIAVAVTRPVIYLHVGQGKTGTTAIQASLVHNYERLRAQGMLYPYHPSFEIARLGRITSGNLDPDDWLHGQILPAIRHHPGYSAYVFSNELLFRNMEELLDGHDGLSREFRFVVLLYVRDPVELLRSSYNQAVKRGGFHGDIEEFQQHEDALIRAAALAEKLDDAGVELIIRNYSVVRERLLKSFYDSIAPGFAYRDEVSAPRANRSLTPAELGFVRQINHIFGREYGTLISDALVEQLPSLSAEPLPLDPALVGALLDRNREAVQLLNRLLPTSERISADKGEAGAKGDGAFMPLNDAQAAVIRKIFPHALTRADAVTLRDIALKFEADERLSRGDAIALLEYARKLRPDGQIIARKLEDLARLERSARGY